ncbi:MAG: DUF5906 domain-containing protein, partial [Lentisphaerae bacterium]|nr:DUF5906 domain-containing protein [Lentisphaerota bacterium]
MPTKGKYDISNTAGVGWVDFLNQRYCLELEVGRRRKSPLRAGSDNPTSFQVNSDGSWHDYGGSCDDSMHGDVYQFLMIRENCGFAQASEIFNGCKPEGSDDIYDAVKFIRGEIGLVADYASSCLQLHPDILAYLHERGLTDETIRNQKFGYLDSIPALEEFLVSKGHSLKSSALWVNNFEGRFVIPYLNRRSEPEYIIGRKINPAEGEPKYVKLLRKGREDLIPHPPFGMNTLARKGIKRVILCEGVIDAITLMQTQPNDAVLASCGGRFSHEQEKLIIGMVRQLKAKNSDLEVVVCMDYDPESETGQITTMELAEISLDNGILANVVLPTDEMLKDKLKVDINSMFVEQGKSAVISTIEKAIPYLDYKMDQAVAITDEFKREEKIVGLLKQLREAGFAENMLRLLLNKRGFNAKNSERLIKLMSPTPQSVAADLATTGNYVYSGCLYVRDSQMFRIPDSIESDTIVRRELENAYRHGNIASKMLKECKEALTHKVNIGANTQACKVDVGSGGWIRCSPLKDPVLKFRNCVIILTENGPEMIEDGGNIFSKLSFDYEYNSKARPSAFLEALSVYLPDPAHRLILQEFGGYLFFPDHIQVQAFLVMIGVGKNGKGTSVRVMREFMGPGLCAAFSLGDFLDTHAVSALVGKRLVTISEIDRHEETNVAAIKEWTGGDTVHVNPKYEKPFDYLPMGKLLITTNVRPYLPDPSDGIFRRVAPIEFKHIIEKPDGRMEAAILSEKAGLMNWAIEGYYSLMKNGAWADRLPADCQRLREEICQGSDPFRQWAAERLIPDQDSLCYVDLAFSNYVNWAQSSKIKQTMAKHSFYMRLRNHTGGAEPVHG